MSDPKFIMGMVLRRALIKAPLIKQRMQPSNKVYFEVLDKYYSVDKVKPQDAIGSQWGLYSDQVYGRMYNTFIWISDKNVNDQ